jgi:hypothetical protein
MIKIAALALAAATATGWIVQTTVAALVGVTMVFGSLSPAHAAPGVDVYFTQMGEHAARFADVIQDIVADETGLECSTFEAWAIDHDGLVIDCEIDGAQWFVWLPRDLTAPILYTQDFAALASGAYGATVLGWSLDREKGEFWAYFS